MQQLIKWIFLSTILINISYAAYFNISQIKQQAQHGEVVVVTAKVTAYTGKDEYVITDNTGSIVVYIKAEDWHKNMIIKNRISEEIEITGYVQKDNAKFNFKQPIACIKAIRIKRKPLSAVNYKTK